jgi:hypothetical protein
MSQETASPHGAPQQDAAAQPNGLLERMEQLMAALNADLSELGAELRRPGVPDDDRG